MQLCMDEAIAEQRDYLFYSRLVKGISTTQSLSKDQSLRMENQMCLSHIFETRHGIPGQRLDVGNLVPSSMVPVNGQDKSSYLRNVTASALALAELGESEEGIFEFDM